MEINQLVISEERIQNIISLATRLHISGQTAKAISFLQNYISKDSGPNEKNSFPRGKIFLIMANFCFEKNNYQKAHDFSCNAIKEKSDCYEAYIIKAKSLFFLKKYFAAKSSLEIVNEMVKNDPNASLDLIRNITTWYGGALFSCGNYEEGINLVQKAINGDVDYREGMYWMSKMYLFCKEYKEAIKWAIQILVCGEKNRYYEENLAFIIKNTPNWQEYLREYAPISKSLGVLYTYLGQVNRDYGNLDSAYSVFQDAIRCCPDDNQIILEEIHVLEYMGDPYKSIKETLNYLSKIQNQKLELIISNDKSVSKKISDIIFEINFNNEDFYSYPLNIQKACQRISIQRQNIKIVSLCEITLKDKDDEFELNNSIISFSHDEEKTIIYPANDLYLIGILFSLAKNLFVSGFLYYLPNLLKMLFEFRQGTSFNKTLIKNESPFLTVIALLSQRLSFKDNTSSKSALYLLGDSHVLTGAWHNIEINGEETLLIPALVTGVKIWHLRESCTFYTKATFEKVVSNIPVGSNVCCVLGEIDCRESILRAVENGLYESMEDAMKVLSEIYIIQINNLKKRFKNVFIHYPPAAIDCTRFIVIKLWEVFDKILVPAFSGDSNVHFLHIDSTLTEDKKCIRKDYILDGTHLNPSYLAILEKQINAALKSELDLS